MPPLGLSYLAATLQSGGHEVEILDLLTAKATSSKITHRLEKLRPHVVGSTGPTMVFPSAAKVLKTCKDYDSQIITVMGGPHVSFAVEDSFKRAPWIDYIVLGEGERTLLELVNTLEKKGDQGEVAGIAFKYGEAIAKTQPRPLIQELDEIPLPARHLLPLARYRALGTACSVVSSRGCPYSCIFCSAPKMFGRKVRFRSPRLVVDEMESIRDLCFERVNLVDDTFTLNHKHTEALCREILRRNLKIEWNAYSRVDTLTPDIVDLMRQAGCTFLVFGVESGNQQVMDNIKKGITVEKVRHAVKMTSSAGIKSFASFILGLPGETPETARDTLSLAREIFEAYGIQYGFHYLAPFPGTEVYEQARQMGIRLTTRDWRRYNANEPITKISPECDRTIREIVADYDQAIKGAWDKIKEWAESGDPVHVESWASKETGDFVWRLLKQDMIEVAGSANGHADPEEARNELVRRLTQKMRLPEPLVGQQIDRLIGKNLLELDTSNRTAAWHWV